MEKVNKDKHLNNTINELDIANNNLYPFQVHIDYFFTKICHM